MPSSILPLFFPTRSCLPRLAPRTTPFLLLILNQLNIILRNNALILLQQELLDLLTHIALHDDLLPPTRRLRHTTARRELLPKVLGHPLQVEAEQLQPGHGRHVLALVALDAADLHARRRQRRRLLLLRGGGLGGLLGRVLRGALLRVERERRGRCFEGVWPGGLVVSGTFWGKRGGGRTSGPETLVRGRVGLLEPFLAFLDGAAEFAELRAGVRQRVCLPRVSDIPSHPSPRPCMGGRGVPTSGGNEHTVYVSLGVRRGAGSLLRRRGNGGTAREGGRTSAVYYVSGLRLGVRCCGVDVCHCCVGGCGVLSWRWS